MGNMDTTNSQNTNLSGTVKDFKVSPMRIEENTSEESYYYNTNWTTYTGYYKSQPVVQQSVDSLNMWAFGRGYETDARTRVILGNITGWGEETFDSIIDNLGRTEDINGDAYAEIIEKENVLINLKVLNPERVRHVVGSDGLIKGYDYWNPVSNKWERKSKKQILHISRNRLSSEIHGTSRIESCKWIIDAKQEAMNDKRRILHRSTIRVMEIDTNNPAEYSRIKTEYAQAIEKGEVMLFPKGTVGVSDFPAISTAEHSEWIRYLDSIFMKAFGVPEVILGGAQEYTEAGSKVGYMTFEQPYITKQRNMEQDLWNKLQIKVSFNRPTSLKEPMQASEAANTGQLGFQPNEVSAQLGRTE